MSNFKKIIIYIVLTVVVGTVLVVMAFRNIEIRRKQLTPQHSYIFDNAKMGYSVIGEGKPVILLHGSMISNPWKGFENRLAESYKVYLPNLPGFGSSDVIDDQIHTTDLFAEALCAFVNDANLKDVPVIAFSLGTVVTVKSVVNGCIKGKLILVGMPSKVKSEKLKKASLIPMRFRRILGSTVWGREKILIPILRDIVGNAGEKRDNGMLSGLEETDTRSLVDLDVYKEIELQVPVLLPKLSNETVFIYGSKDKLIDSTKDLVLNPIVIEGAEHNVFRTHPDKLLSLLKDILQ
jgi:pimeloyl-ACP methyl ester carboxylesterase